MSYVLTDILPHHLSCRIILRGHIDDLDLAAEKLYPRISFFAPVIFRETPQDELHIFIDEIEGIPINMADLMPEDVEIARIETREGEVWDG